MTWEERSAIITAAFAYAQANFTFEVGLVVRCDDVADGIYVVITDGIRAVRLRETFASADAALSFFQGAQVKQLSLWKV